MSSASPSIIAPRASDFIRRAETVKPSKADINAVIMDYLITEGYPIAAQKFAVEANVEPKVSTQAFELQARVGIRQAILSGNVERAIEKINDFNPGILDTDPELHFSLLRLQHLEIIRRVDRNNDTEKLGAINFAKGQLAPRIRDNEENRKSLEQNMMLLVFDPDKLQPPLRVLMDPTMRLDIATKVNEAILKSQGAAIEARIKDLIRLRQWAETKAREMQKSIPPRLNLGLDPEEWEHPDAAAETLNGHGDDPMVT